MKNKKRFFNKNLYLEGLRQLKTTGLIGTVISLIFAIVMPVGTYLSVKAEYRFYANGNIEGQFTKHAVNIVDYHIYYLLFFLLFAPMMIMVLFRFLNRREDCDFYHSLPHTRQCLFLSFFAAAVTWLVVQIFTATAVSSILYQVFSDYMVFEFSRLVCFSANILAVSLLVASVLLLACTLSGNTVTSLVVFLILFFTPRIFITIYLALMTSQLDYLANNLNSIFSIKHNLFYMILQSINSNSAMYAEVTSIGLPLVFTLLAALILFFIAYIFFAKRKSEAAQNSMNNKTLQAIFRTIFTMLLCMVPISILFDLYVRRNIISYGEDYDNNAIIVFYIIISYIAVILGMFLYELLTTKSAKNALRSLKSIPFIAALNTVIFLLLVGSFGHYKNLRLDEEKIDSVNIISLGHFYNYNYGHASYFEEMLSRYDFTESNLISLLCTSFNDYADKYNDYLDGKREFIYNDSSYNLFSVAVEFHGTSDYTFHLLLDSKTEDQFYKLLYSDEEFYDIYMNLPELTDKDSLYFFDEGEEIPDEAFTKELYESLRTELAEGKINPKQWIESIGGYMIGNINVSKYIESVYYEISLPISPATPKTYHKLLDYYSKTHTKDLEGFLGRLRDFEELTADSSNNKNSLYLNITGYDSINENTAFLSFSSTDFTWAEYGTGNSPFTKDISLLKEYTKPLSDMNPEEDILIYARAEETNGITEDYKSDFYILCIPMEIFKQMNTSVYQ